MERGRLIVVEGIDGSGKSTLSKSLARAIGATCVREPGDTEFGENIREGVLMKMSAEARPGAAAMTMLYAAARAELFQTVVGPELDAGRDVVSDRSYISSLAYNADESWSRDDVMNINAKLMTRFNCWPDVILIMDLNERVAMDRITMERSVGAYEADGLEAFRRRREFYYLTARHYAGMDSHVHVVDATRPKDEVLANVVGLITSGR